MNSPLQLRRLVFTQVHVDALVDVAPGVANIATNASLGVSLSTSNPRLVLLKLEVRFGPAEGSPPVYSGNVIAQGEFNVDEKVALETSERLAVINGASILYGAIREMVTNITARGPLGIPLILASMSFVETADQALKEIAAKRAATEGESANTAKAEKKD